MGRPREEVPPRRREKQAPGPRIETLADLRQGHPWWWFVCRNPECGRAVPIAIVPLMIRWGRNYPVEELRRNTRCTACGHCGVNLSMRSWSGSAIGYSPWPVRRFDFRVKLYPPSLTHEMKP